MLTIYSDDHRLHHGRHELIGGQFTPCFEKPSRADMVLDRVKAVGLGVMIAGILLIKSGTRNASGTPAQPRGEAVTC